MEEHGGAWPRAHARIPSYEVTVTVTVTPVNDAPSFPRPGDIVGLYLDRGHQKLLFRNKPPGVETSDTSEPDGGRVFGARRARRVVVERLYGD